MPISRSSRAFAERAGLRLTVRGPAPVFEHLANLAHAEPVAPPLPVPEHLYPTQGNPSPDRGATEEWPHGTIQEP